MATAWHEIYPITFAKAQVKLGVSPADFDGIIDGWIAAGGSVEEPALLYMAGTERADLTPAEIEALAFKQLDHQKELLKIGFRLLGPKV